MRLTRGGFRAHVKIASRIVSYRIAALRQLRHLRRYVTDDCLRSLVVSLVHSRLDYGNSVLVWLPASPPVCSRRCGSSGVSPKSLRSCLGRRCNSILAASTTTSRLQGVRHDISCAAWSRATVPERSCSCRRPARSSPTSLVIITSTACSTIPAHNRRSTHISSRCIAPLELIAI